MVLLQSPRLAHMLLPAYPSFIVEKMHVNPPGARDVAQGFASSFTCLLIHSFIINSCRVIGLVKS
ncbi:hypothetical protein SDJN02_01883 [Cucurbita argyrosperma subsp. argyrosperma]|nr:hypothetical protein SDJN02_01883 [Cucurbita argyrosperma subsp. argyrosperma]